MDHLSSTDRAKRGLEIQQALPLVVSSVVKRGNRAKACVVPVVCDKLILARAVGGHATREKEKKTRKGEIKNKKFKKMNGEKNKKRGLKKKVHRH